MKFVFYDRHGNTVLADSSWGFFVVDDNHCEPSGEKSLISIGREPDFDSPEYPDHVELARAARG